MTLSVDTAHTMSIMCPLPSWCYTYGRNTSWTYDSQKVPAAAGFSTYKMASPSNTTTSTLVSSCSSGASSRHRTMSGLVPSWSFPLTDSDGGHGWFSWEKNSLRFPSRNWDATCNLQKRSQSDFSAMTRKSTSVGPLAYIVQLHDFNNIVCTLE